jgi:hypothetical protein
MNRIKTLFASTAAVATLLGAGAAFADAAATAAPAPPPPSPMPYPAITAPMAANPYPATFDAGPLGKLTVDGVISGGGFYQSDPTTWTGQKSQYGDITNAQVIINKTDGPIQFYIQAGAYSIVSLGSGYVQSSTYDNETFGYVPQGFVKIVPNSSFSIEAGALPTLIGAEYTFSFQNMNIERGLLWNSEPAISKGVQVNYSHGPWAVSAAYTDGYYSGTYSALSGSIGYTFKNSDTLVFAAEGNVAPNHVNTFVTPVFQNQGDIFNLIYTHSSGPWTITPYFQYTSSPRNRTSLNGDTYGGAILTKYNFTPEISLSGRFEYVKSDGPANLLFFGENSSAWSLTITPMYQKGIFFIRGEGSYTGVSGYQHSFVTTFDEDPITFPGLGFGKIGNSGSQFRLMGEAGVMF